MPLHSMSDMCLSSSGVREHQLRSDTDCQRKEEVPPIHLTPPLWVMDSLGNCTFSSSRWIKSDKACGTPTGGTNGLDFRGWVFLCTVTQNWVLWYTCVPICGFLVPWFVPKDVSHTHIWFKRAKDPKKSRA